MSIIAFGALSDGKTLNTEKIQSCIDHLHAAGGGTLIVPLGVFLTGALFLKPGVNIYLSIGSVLKGSTDVGQFPKRRTRVEGHFQEFLPALLNAEGCDHLRISGTGTLDGNGAPFWQEFDRRSAADRTTKNLDVLRPRIALIQKSRDVQITGITFRDSPYWNLHLYRCSDVLVQDVRFEVPDEAHCPSSDGTDIDSCQHVTIRRCTYRVDDDAVCLKGSKGPFAMNDKDSPPTEHIRVEDCVFERAHGAVTLGSEATVVRDVLVERCRIIGKIPLVRLKFRPDTPQLYEDVHFRDITLIGTGHSFRAELFDARPWKQYFDLQNQPPPQSIARNVSLTNVRGSYGSFGEIRGNVGQTELSNFTLANIAVKLTGNPKLRVGEVTDLKIYNVIVNGKPLILENL